MRDAEIEELEAMFRGLEVPANEETPWSYVILDRQFHWRIVELSGNPQLVTALGSINMQIFAYQFGMSRSMAESLPEHHEILRASAIAMPRSASNSCESTMAAQPRAQANGGSRGARPPREVGLM